MTKHLAGTSLLIVSAIVLTACEARSPVSPGPAAPMSANSEMTGATPAAANIKAGSAAVLLCHITGNGRYHPSVINANAAPAHQAHGDAAIGGAVPGAVGMVFDESCNAVLRSFVITSGSWVVSRGSWPGFVFDVDGQDIRLVGTWAQAGPGPSLTYTAGSVITLQSVFQNATPQTIASFARGTAVVGGIDYGFVELGGDLTFNTDPITIPNPAPGIPGQRLVVTTAFTLSGTLKGYDVLNRQEPLLVFEVPVSGRGTATLELMSGPAGSQNLLLGTLRYDFGSH